MSPGPRQKAPCRDNCPFPPSFVSFCRQTFQSRPPQLLLSEQPRVSNPPLAHLLTSNTFLVTWCSALPLKNPMNSQLGAQNFECELIWDCWRKIKSKLFTSLSVGWFLIWQYSTTLLEDPVRHQPVWPLEPLAVGWTAPSREGLGTKWDVVPPDGIPGPPSPQNSNPLSSLDPTGLHGEVDQLAWSFCLDLVSLSLPLPGKSALSQVPSHWVEVEFDQLLGTSKRSSAG
jgi:hypothetical protein